MAAFHAAVPIPGEHTDEILAGIGYDTKVVAAIGATALFEVGFEAIQRETEKSTNVFFKDANIKTY